MDIMRMGGVYRIRNTANGKVYIGSTVNFEKRFQCHRRDFRKGKNSRHLQHAWQKYGEECFEFEPLLVCSPENLLMYEQLCIDKFKACDPEFGYNLSPTAGNVLGIRRTDETKEKIAASRTGTRMSEESRRKLSAAKTGKPNPKLQGRQFTAEQRRRMSDGKKGKPGPNLGKKMTDHQRLVISERMRGKAIPPEQRAKISESLKASWSDGPRRHSWLKGRGQA